MSSEYGKQVQKNPGPYVKFKVVMWQSTACHISNHKKVYLISVKARHQRCLKMPHCSIIASHEASQRNDPTVPRRHNKCCINHCVSPGRQQCIMNDWCLALLLHVLMHAQGSFSWNNSFDDPRAGGGRVRQEHSSWVISVWNIDRHWWTITM